MHIVVAADKHFGQHLLVMLYSLFSNYTGDRISVHAAITDPLFSRAAAALTAAFDHDFHSISSDSVIEQLPVSRVHQILTATPYVRLLADRLISPEIDKVLYLDSDIIVRQNVQQLWHVDLKTHSLAASNCHGASKDRAFVARFGGRYFNSGVMLMNLREWRQREIGARCLAFLRDNPEKIRFVDQCALNYICTDWMWIDVTWNFTTQIGSRWARALGTSEKRFLEAQRDPAIVHFVGSTKPWSRPAAELSRFDTEYWTYRTALMNRSDMRGMLDGHIAAA